MLKDSLVYTSANLIVMDINNTILVDRKLLKMPLSEKYYEEESEKLFGKRDPCILERIRIEYLVCAKAAKKLESGKKYSLSEIGWFKDLYNLKGEYIVLTY